MDDPFRLTPENPTGMGAIMHIGALDQQNGLTGVVLF